MNITVFFDGSPGHEKQSLALVRALQTMLEVEVRHVAVDSLSPFNRLVDTCRLFLLRDGGCRYPALGAADLLIGTGSRTHIPLLSCRKKYGVPAITCMTPDFHLRHMFDLCFVPRHDGVRAGANIFVTDGPPVLPMPEYPRDPAAGLILLGGIDRRSHFWNTAEVISYVQTIASRSPEIRWHLSSSPRTPEQTVQEVKDLAARLDNVVFFHYRDTPRGWIEEQYARARTVWVTADSMSMMYEALTAGCRVGVLPLAWKHQKNKFQKSIDFLVEKELAVTYAAWQRGEASWREEVNFNEAKRCAQAIVARWFPKN